MNRLCGSPSSSWHIDDKNLLLSNGGSINETLMLISATDFTDKTVYGIGPIASCGVVLFMSFPRRFLSYSAKLFYHDPYLRLDGNFTKKDLINCLDEIDIYFDAVREVLGAHYDILMRNSDVWLTPEQCIKLGLIHGIIPLTGGF